MRICKASDCTNRVPPRPTPGKPREYCSDQCRDREKARRYRKLRAKKGLCPQCGGPMDSPVSPHRNKVSPQYCTRCQEYFRERHQKKKEPAS
jgi:hypothetical protein